MEKKSISVIEIENSQFRVRNDKMITVIFLFFADCISLYNISKKEHVPKNWTMRIEKFEGTCSNFYLSISIANI